MVEEVHVQPPPWSPFRELLVQFSDSVTFLTFSIASQEFLILILEEAKPFIIINPMLPLASYPCLYLAMFVILIV